MKPTTRSKLAKLACVVCFLGIGLFAIPVRSQTYAYVTNQSYDAVAVVDTRNNAVTDFVGVGGAPFWVAVTPDGDRAYVTNQASNSVSVIETVRNRLMATIKVGNLPSGIAISAEGTRAYVANSTSNSVSVIDTEKNAV